MNLLVFINNNQTSANIIDTFFWMLPCVLLIVLVNCSTEIKPSDLEQIVKGFKESNSSVFIFQYIPLCRFCQEFAPQFEQRANEYTHTVKFTRVNCQIAACKNVLGTTSVPGITLINLHHAVTISDRDIFKSSGILGDFLRSFGIRVNSSELRTEEVRGSAYPEQTEKPAAEASGRQLIDFECMIGNVVMGFVVFMRLIIMRLSAWIQELY